MGPRPSRSHTRRSVQSRGHVRVFCMQEVGRLKECVGVCICIMSRPRRHAFLSCTTLSLCCRTNCFCCTLTSICQNSIPSSGICHVSSAGDGARGRGCIFRCVYCRVVAVGPPPACRRRAVGTQPPCHTCVMVYVVIAVSLLCDCCFPAPFHLPRFVRKRKTGGGKSGGVEDLSQTCHRRVCALVRRRESDMS